MASRLGATINKILDLCRAHSQVIAVLHQARGRAALLLALVFVCRLLFFCWQEWHGERQKRRKISENKEKVICAGLAAEGAR
jgi:hypothetical protein